MVGKSTLAQPRPRPTQRSFGPFRAHAREKLRGLVRLSLTAGNSPDGHGSENQVQVSARPRPTGRHGLSIFGCVMNWQCGSGVARCVAKTACVGLAHLRRAETLKERRCCSYAYPETA